MDVSMEITPRATRSAFAGKCLIAAAIAVAALSVTTSASFAQVALKTYADEKGYISVRSLTCAQLAGTFQEDADFLGVWYSGWFNGRNKGHLINVGRTKEGIHQAIVYCKAHPDKKVTEAVEAVLQGK